jgi:TolB-like protein
MRVPAKASLGLLFALFAAAFAGSAFGQDAAKAHVAVVRFANKTDSSSYDAACKAATDTLFLTLSELGRYRVQTEDAAGSTDDALRAMAEDKHVDFIMYGKMAKSAGGIDCSLSVFDRAKGKTTLSQSKKAAGVLDIFDATDELVVSVLQSMTGAHIGFGSLTLTNTGEKGSYAVLVDGTAVGSDLSSLDRLLIGQRAVTVTQKRMLGEREIARTSVVVKEGETAELSFAVPLLMDDEKKKVEELKASIDAGWNKAGATGDLDSKTAELLALFGSVAYSPKLASYKAEATQIAGEWALRKNRLAIEGSAWDPKAELLDSAGAIYAGAKAYPEPEKIRKAFTENAQLLATLFELKAGQALGDRDFEQSLACFESALILSTRFLGGARLTDYAYAVTTLKDFQEKSGAQNADAAGDKDLKTVFGPMMAAGGRFFGMRKQIE